MDLLIRLEPQSRRLRYVRRMIDAWLDGHGLRGDAVQLIATELLTNAFAVTPQGARVELELRRTPGTVEIMVNDRGPGFDPQLIRGAGDGEVRGRGLVIVRELADQLLVRREDGVTRITASVGTPQFDDPDEEALSAAADPPYP